MKITGTRCYIDVETNGKIARFGGELGMNGFYAVKNSMRWLPPHDCRPVTDKECNQIVEAIIKESAGKEFQIFFD